MLSFLAQTSAESDITWIKWMALTAMVVSLLVGILWTIWLIRDLNSDRASKESVNRIEKRLGEVEDMTERRITKIYEDLRHHAEMAGKALSESANAFQTNINRIYQDLGEVSGLVQALRKGGAR